jgi:hypothetical protein
MQKTLIIMTIIITILGIQVKSIPLELIKQYDTKILDFDMIGFSAIKKLNYENLKSVLKNDDCESEKLRLLLSLTYKAIKTLLHKFPSSYLDIEFLAHLQMTKNLNTDVNNKITFISGFIVEIIEDTTDIIENKINECVTKESIARNEKFLALAVTKDVMSFLTDQIPILSNILDILDMAQDITERMIDIKEQKEDLKLTLLKKVGFSIKLAIKKLNTLLPSLTLQNKDIQSLFCQVRLKDQDLRNFIYDGHIIYTTGNDKQKLGICAADQLMMSSKVINECPDLTESVKTCNFKIHDVFERVNRKCVSISNLDYASNVIAKGHIVSLNDKDICCKNKNGDDKLLLCGKIITD